MNSTQFKVEQARKFTPQVANQIRHLAQKIGRNYKPLSDEDVKSMLNSPHHFIFVVKGDDDKFVGMVTLLILRIPYAKKATIEDLVVDENQRGKKIGTRLLNEAIEKAKNEKVSYIDLTSRPRREGGNMLYEKIGFKKRDTNVYRLIVDYNEV